MVNQVCGVLAVVGVTIFASAAAEGYLYPSQKGPGGFHYAAYRVVTTSLPTELSQVRFARDSAALTPEAVAILDRLANLLRRFPEIRIALSGNTDLIEATTETERVVRGHARAEAVAAHLIERGIEPARMTVRGNPVPLVVLNPMGNSNPTIVDETFLASMHVVNIYIPQP